jgi:hypothetical protein
MMRVLLIGDIKHYYAYMSRSLRDPYRGKTSGRPVC